MSKPARSPWVKPQFSRSQVRAAGKTLIDPELSQEKKLAAEQVLDNWRASHAFPLNTCQMLLRRVASNIDPTAAIVQRMKRRPSVLRKLKEQESMSLERMQDIAGCRAVVANLHQVYEVVEALQSPRLRHKSRAPVDYIKNPKADGYRSVHLVLQYTSDKNTTYNKHLIEVQVRTLLQHAWSTAVETSGTFLGHDLKGGHGPSEWLEFFRLVSLEFAKAEGMPPHESDSPSEAVRARIAELATSLRIESKLTAFAATLNITEPSDKNPVKGSYYLLDLAPNFVAHGLPRSNLSVAVYSRKDAAKANADYSKRELDARANGRESDVVLVSADSLEAVRAAYRNYWVDAQLFLASLDQVLSGEPVEPKEFIGLQKKLFELDGESADDVR